MEVRSGRIAWSDSRGRDRVATVTGAGIVLGADVDVLGVCLVLGADRIEVSVCPKEEVTIGEVSLTLRAGLANADALYLNGYNSWTDSVERRPADRMPGIGVPRAVVDHWVLDGSGDYRFVEQDLRRGRQHGFGYGYLRYGRSVQFFGSTDEDSGLTLITEDLGEGTLSFSKEPPVKPLEVGREKVLISIFLGEGRLEDATASWIAASGKNMRPARPVVGYSSWYRHYTDISEEKLLSDLAGAHEQLAGRDLGECVPLFQIDDGYALVGDWGRPDEEKFPHGLAPVAKRIAAAGFRPGIWIAPFVCERKSRFFSDHPEWLLRDEAGETVATGSHWSGQVALDLLNPEVREHVAESLGMLVRCGFSFLKCDFLYAACMIPHGGMNRGELMADALELLRGSVPEGMWLDLCGVPLVSAIGRAEFCRVGCDVGLNWDDVPHMRLTGRERVSTKNSLANTRGRAHLDGRAFRCDPDVFFLRGDVRLTDSQRQELLGADSRLGGVFLTSDDMAQWDEESRAAYEAALSTFVERSKEGR